MVYYINRTSRTLAHDAAELIAWTEAIPEEAVQYDFLMDGLLAMASLHFAFYNPDSRRQYTEFAIRYQNEGLQKYNDTLGDINETNCTALFAFSILINIMAIALPNADPNSANSAHTESLMTMLELGRGIGIIHSKSVTLLTNGKLGSFFRPSPGDLDPDDETRAALEKLRQHTDSLLQFYRQRSPCCLCLRNPVSWTRFRIYDDLESSGARHWLACDDLARRTQGGAHEVDPKRRYHGSHHFHALRCTSTPYPASLVGGAYGN
jgi:hypothetical protein